MAHRLAPQARAELSNIWTYIVKEGGNIAAADDVIDAITERFYLLSQYPRMAAPAMICAPACAALPSGNT
jgi:plasmid stabilization system protein ParE